MADTVEAIKAELDGLKTDIATQNQELSGAVGRVGEDVKSLEDKIAELQSQVGSGQAVTVADLQGLRASAQTVTAGLKALDPIPDNPPVA